MRNSKTIFGLSVVGVIVVAAMIAIPMIASAGDPPMAGREVTMTGKVFDLHCWATGNYPSADRAKCTADCIRAGVPAVLETTTGPVLLGQGARNASALLAPLAFQNAEIRGKLFEKDGVKYIDVQTARAVPMKTPPPMPSNDEDDD